MVDLSSAQRSEVLKLQFRYDDFLIFRQCLSTVFQRKDKLPEDVCKLIEKNIVDLHILLETLTSEGNIE